MFLGKSISFTTVSNPDSFQQFLYSLPPPNLESHKSLITLIFQNDLLQYLNQISLPTGMTIPITAAVTVESKPWPLFESVITEIFHSFTGFKATAIECFMAVSCCSAHHKVFVTKEFIKSLELNNQGEE